MFYWALHVMHVLQIRREYEIISLRNIFQTVYIVQCSMAGQSLQIDSKKEV